MAVFGVYTIKGEGQGKRMSYESAANSNTFPKAAFPLEGNVVNLRETRSNINQVAYLSTNYNCHSERIRRVRLRSPKASRISLPGVMLQNGGDPTRPSGRAQANTTASFVGLFRMTMEVG